MTDKEKAKEFLYGEYSEETVKKKRVFPTRNIVFLSFILLIQIAAILFAIFYNPKPQDRIDSYTVTVNPLSDGSLDIEYRFLWTPLDKSEELTWVEIGIANDAFTVYDDSLSDTVERAEKYIDGDYISTLIYFKKPYTAGEQLEFSFKINQKHMITSRGHGYYFELVPGWFNSTPIGSYTFKWLNTGMEATVNCDRRDETYFIWEGSMEPGDYRKMSVDYPAEAFVSPAVSRFESFDSSGAYNELSEDKIGVVIVMSVIAFLLIFAELYIIDSFVSYNRGRGFLRGYGYHVHTYGRINPLYRTEAQKRGSSARGGGRSGGGCACACACACAGGGRAGCSQKNTYQNKLYKRINAPSQVDEKLDLSNA